MKNLAMIFLLAMISSCSSNEKIEKFEFQSPNFELLELAEGVYACIHKFGGKAICNVGIIDNGKETIIFDTFLDPKVTEELIELVAN